MSSFLAAIRASLISAVSGLALALSTHAATHTVTFSNNSFSPSSLTVNVGDTVRFQNGGGVHTVTGTGADPFCGNDAVSASCDVTFSQPGTFAYRCLFHSTVNPEPAGMIGSITVVGGGTEKPNLVPFHLNGWTSPVVVSRAPGNNISDPDFFDDQDIFLDWAMANISLTAGIQGVFFTELLIDGVSKASWSRNEGLMPDTFVKIEDYNLGKLPTGTHIFRLVTDHTGVVDESSEDDNTHEVSVRVIPTIANKHVVLVSNNRYNPASLTLKKGDTVDFRVLEGSHTATGTSSADPFCGENAIPQVCSVTFNTTGTFPYRCLFHSSGGANPAGMVGQVRVIDPIIVERATQVEGPYTPSPDATVSYPNQTVSFPAPGGTTFWRLNSSAALRIVQAEIKSSSVLLKFE